jgi:hypothetical protein
MVKFLQICIMLFRRIIERRKHASIFKLGRLMVFKQFFDKREVFDALLDYYNKDRYSFEFKSVDARNNVLKFLERNGFDYDLVEDLKGCVEPWGREQGLTGARAAYPPSSYMFFKIWK